MFVSTYYDRWSNKMHFWHLVDGKQVYEKVDYENDYYVVDKTGKSNIKSIYNEPVVKQIAKNSDSVKILRESGEKLFESDLSPDVKFLHKYYGCEDLNINYNDYVIANIDIEIQVEDVFPDQNEARFPINLITVHFPRTNELFTLGLNPYTGDNKEVKYFHCESEQILLERFCKLIKFKKTTIISGWNIGPSVKGFDIPYIVNRIDKLGLRCSLSPINKTIRKNNGDIEIVGINIIDMMNVYKKFTYQNHPSNTLNYIANFELGEGKIDFEGTFQTIYKENWNLFVDYNIQDTLLVSKIDAKKKLMDLVINLCTQTRTPFEKVFSTISIVEGYILKYLHKENMVMPDKKFITGNDTIDGGYVYGLPGFYRFLASIDGESLYPTIIRQFNISPETKVLNDDGSDLIKCSLKDIFYKKEEGIIPKIVTTIFKERKELKGIATQAELDGDYEKFNYYDSQQLIRKILINCFHPDTHIMTCDGIKDIKDVKVGDMVFSMNPVTKELEEKKVISTIKKHYDGDMYTFRNSRCGVTVTEDHDMFRQHHEKTSFESIKAKDLYNYNYMYLPQHTKREVILPEYIYLNDWVDNISDYYFILKTNEDSRTTMVTFRNLGLEHIKILTHMGTTSRKTFKYIENVLTNDEIDLLEKNGYQVYVRNKRDAKTVHQRLRIKNKNFSRFIGWYLSEGCLFKSKYKEYANTKRGVSKKISISQYKNINEDNWNEIDNMLLEIADTHCSDKKCLTFSSDLLFDVIENNFGSKFDKRLFKTELGYKLDLELVHESLYKGDGNKEKYRYTITEKNPLFFQDFMKLIVMIGSVPKWSNDTGCYRINRRDQTHFVKAEHITKFNYSGDVYCLNVEDNHTLLAGSKDSRSFIWTGNCMYGVLCNSHFHFYDLDNASVITSTGREVIQYVSSKINHYIKNEFPLIAKNYYPNFVDNISSKPHVIYCDTDSNYINLEDVYKSCNVDKDFLHFVLEFEEIILNPYLKKIMKEYAEKYNCKQELLNFKREKVILKQLVQAKKKYATSVIANEKKIYDKPTLKVTGLEVVRSDLSKFSKDSLKKFLNLMFEGDVPDKKILLNHVRQAYKQMKQEDISNIALPKSVATYDKYDKDISEDIEFEKGTPIFNKASMIYNLIVKENKLPYMEINNGSKMKYVFVRPNNKFNTNVVAFIGNYPKEFNEIFKIDYDMIFEKQYLNIVQRIFDVLEFGQITMKDSNLMKLFDE